MRTTTLLFAALAASAAAILSPSRDQLLSGHLRGEAIRLRVHFDRVDVELRERDVAALSPGQRAARSELLGWLREYRHAGAFPLNDGFSLETVPIFRDRRGVLCAMAYLIARSGREDLVAGVAASRNLARIAELADDPRLTGWLDSVGLSVAEAGAIQPTYPPPTGTVWKRDAVSSGYAIGSVLVSGAAIGSGVLNLTGRSRARGVVGLLAGAGALATGLARMDEEGATGKVATADFLIGSAALAIGVGRLLERQPARAASSAIRVTPALLRTERAAVLGVMLQASF